VLVDVENSLVGAGFVQFGHYQFLGRQDNAVFSAQSYYCTAVFHGFHRVFHLENAPVRRELRSGKIVLKFEVMQGYFCSDFLKLILTPVPIELILNN
jgi:hypothetical protein